ncbi:toprim domain-containing protein [Nocardia fluminea]|uniref:toprim domain-containing protein n=1 Tax=Nocardia fluminea TaxID=134984 RepID=UPI00365AF62F
MSVEQPVGSWSTITSALEARVGEGKPSGAWTKYCCPSHEGDGRAHRPSLAVKYDQDQQRTVVRCFAGCENEQVLDALGLEVRDMFDRRLERAAGRGRANRPRPQQLSRADRALTAAGMPLKQAKKADLGRQVSRWATTATYPYARADGTVAGEVIRREARFEHGRDKDFRQSHWTENGSQPGGFEPIPFQLPRVLDAVAEGGVVYVCEGEKDVLAAERAGLTATTNAGGALSWSAQHAQWLAGARTVVIVADHDTAGYRRAERVLTSLVGLVETVRVVEAATGKDLTDHLNCGHEISELVPVPHLDPFTTTAAVSAAASVEPTLGGTPMPEYLLMPSGEPTHQHADEVDNIGGQWAGFMRIFMQHLTEVARRMTEQRRREEQIAREALESERLEIAQRHEAERAAVEIRLRKLADAGLDTASRTQLADAVVDAAAWREDSQVAAQMMTQLSTQVHTRFGVRVDPVTGEVTSSATPDLAGALMGAESDRAANARLRTAQDRMVELVAGVEDLDEDRKPELYAAIEQWRAHPSAAALTELTTTLTEAGVPEKTRTELRFVAVYLGRPDQVVPVNDLAATRALTPTGELRRLAEPLVDPGEEVKPRIDALLLRYQDRLKHGVSTDSVRAELAESVTVMTAEDRTAARERGKAIRTNPAGEFPALWPDHVDRDELGTQIRMYATLAPQAELAAGKASDLDDATAAGLTRQAAKHRKAIQKALTTGKGLHPLEKDQISAVLRDVEAGSTSAPELLWADDRSAAAVDSDRATRIAHDTSYAHRRQLDQILKSNQAPEGTVRRVRNDVTRVMDVQTQLGTGRTSLPDYERTGIDRQLGAKLASVGVAEPLRNKVQHHLDYAAGEAATAGKQAARIADRWAERREAVAISRAVTATADEMTGSDYDSPERRAGLEKVVRATGMGEDSIAQRMAADAGRAKPPSAAAKAGAKPKRRTTTQGAGVNRVHHRGRGGRGPGQGLGK